MAGLLYLPRLFVYHAMAPVGSDRSETFKIMERRLLRGIMNPAMLATLGFGLMLAATPGCGRLASRLDLGQACAGCWRWLPITAWLARWRGRLRRGSQQALAATFFESINEFPTLALIAIVVLVVVKPF